MKIEYPMGSAYDFDTNSVAFPAEIDGKRTRCLVTAEALQDHFGSVATDMLVELFEANRGQVEAVASEKIRAGATTNILIKTRDM